MRLSNPAQASRSGNDGCKGGGKYTGVCSDAAMPRAARFKLCRLTEEEGGLWGSVQPSAQ